jgi:xanthine/CO dehydrogenase XdhC/CoxF family maturation factor
MVTVPVNFRLVVMHTSHAQKPCCGGTIHIVLVPTTVNFRLLVKEKAKIHRSHERVFNGLVVDTAVVTIFALGRAQSVNQRQEVEYPIYPQTFLSTNHSSVSYKELWLVLSG